MTTLRELGHILGRKIVKDDLLKSFAKSGKAGITGALVDGCLGAGKAIKLERAKVIDAKTVKLHTLNEATCGLVTSTAGTLGTSIATLILGSKGPASLVIGLGASVGARFIYRNNFPSILPEDEEIEVPVNEEDAQKMSELYQTMANMGGSVPEKLLRRSPKYEEECEDMDEDCESVPF